VNQIMKHTAKALILTPVALALLAGCAHGTASLPPISSPVADNAQQVTPSLQARQVNQMGPEVLTATHVTITSYETGGYQCHPHAGACPLLIMPSSEAAFKVHGTASGSVAGTFTANGEWGSSFGAWRFSENFTIKSGSAQIPGKLEASGRSSCSRCDGSSAQGPHVSFGRSAAFGPITLGYTADEDLKGRALVAIKRSAFNETLSDFGY
jgi:hypothetical protein